MNCDDVRAALLGGEASEAISLHLQGCVACRRSVGTIDLIRSELSSESVWVEPPADLEETIVAAIVGVDQPRTHAPTQDSTPSKTRVTRRSRGVMLGFAAAAVVLVAIAFSLLSRAPAPDWEVAMVGTGANPEATAVVAGWNTDAGTRLLLESSNLAPAPEGSIYQLWFSEGSTNVSAGTFTDPSRVELTVGIARKDYPNVWISLHPINAGTDPGPALLHSIDAP
ncbi:MAG: anti-sigma factor [Acidimicrobiia bacterium]|nr:anti-sigma factor [Acidimicrobiia bacterium]